MDIKISSDSRHERPMQKLNSRTFKVSGMTCTACAGHVERALRPLPGFISCRINLMSNTLQAEYDAGLLDEATMIKAVAEAGYGLSPLEQSWAQSQGLSVDAGSYAFTDDRRPRWRLLISLIFCLPLFYLAMGAMLGWPLPAILRGEEHQLWNGLVQLLLVLPIVAVNRNIYRRGALHLCQRAADMDSLIALSTGATLIFSLWELLKCYRGAGSPAQFHFDCTGTILTLVSWGKYWEERTKKRTGQALLELSQLTPATAHIQVTDAQGHNEIRLIPVANLQVGDTLVLQPGEKATVDGTVLEGSSLVDESALTGESQPARKEPGSPMLGGTVNGTGKLLYRAEKVGADTCLAQIISLAEQAASSKARLARLADRAASVFVPIVIGAALLSATIWLLQGSSLDLALSRAAAVLVVSCPCALALATPASLMAGVGRAAQLGILMKTAAAFEELAEIDTICLDKTGTLTQGNALKIPTAPCAPSQPGTPDAPTCQEDHLKPEAPAALQRLRDLGLTTIMLSGDKKTTAQKIAEQLGIKEFRAELLPPDKASCLRELTREGRICAMAGDGINDAPALALAHVGISVNGAADCARQLSDIVLLNDNLHTLADTVELSRAVTRNIKQNLFWALGYNALAIPLAAGAFYHSLGWQLNPMAAALLMSMSSLCVLSNALRLNKFSPHSPLIARPAATSTTPQAPEAAVPTPYQNEDKPMQHLKVTIEGMMCQHCQNHVDKALNALPGIKARVVLEDNAAYVEGENIDQEALKAAISAAGYQVTAISTEP